MVSVSWKKCKNSSQEYTLSEHLGDANLVNISMIHTISTCWGCTLVEFVNDILLRQHVQDANLLTMSKMHTISTCWGHTLVDLVNDTNHVKN